MLGQCNIREKCEKEREIKDSYQIITWAAAIVAYISFWKSTVLSVGETC